MNRSLCYTKIEEIVIIRVIILFVFRFGRTREDNHLSTALALRRDDNKLPTALALHREAPKEEPEGDPRRREGVNSHHRHVRQEYDDTVDCVDKTCFFYHQLTTVCHIYVKANETAICEVPCDMSGCVDEVHLDIDCPIWVCTPKITTSTTSTSTLRPTTTPASRGECSSLTCILAVTGNVLMGLILVVLFTAFLVNKFRSRLDRRSSTDESRPLLNARTSLASSSEEQPAVLPVQPATTVSFARISRRFNVQPHRNLSDNMEDIPLLPSAPAPTEGSCSTATACPSTTTCPPATATLETETTTTPASSTSKPARGSGFLKKMRESASQLRHATQLPRFGKKLEKKESKESVTSLDRGFLSAWGGEVTPPFDSMSSFSRTPRNVPDSGFMPTAPPMLNSASLPNLAKEN